MEDYREALKKILTPSLFLFLVAAASAHLGFALSAGGPAFTSGGLPEFLFNQDFSAGIILFAAALILLPLIYYSKIRTGPTPERTGNKKLQNTAVIKLLLLMILACVITASIISRIEKRSREQLPLTILDNSLFTISGKITNLKKKRYGSEILLEFTVLNRIPEDGERNPLPKGHLYLQEETGLQEGKIITMKCRIKKIRSGREISSFKMNLLRQGVTCDLFPVAGTVKISGTGNCVKSYRIRELLAHRIGLLFPVKTASLVRALFFGERKHLSRETMKSFMKAGVLHVLAASGLHVGILAWIPMLLLGSFRVHRRIILFVTSALLILYLTITGMPVSLVRASLMFAIAALVFISGLEKNMLNILFLTALAVVVMAPEELYTPGFQLSFGATAGIILFFRIFREIFSFLPGFPGTSVSVTLSAQVFVLPLVAYHMENINFTGIISNIAVIPAVSLLMVISILSVLISPLLLDAGILLGRVTDGIYTVILKFVERVSHLNGHFTAGLEMTIPLLICIACILFIYPLVKKKELFSIPLIICITAIWYTLSRENSESRKIFTLFESQGKRSLLINRGSSRFLMGSIPDIKTAKAIVRKIEEQSMEGIILGLSDPDFNNARSYGYIIKRVKVNRCIISPEFEFSEPVKQLFTLAERNRIKIDLSDIKTESKLIGEYKTGTGKSGYAGALAAYNRLISENKINKKMKRSDQVLVVNLDQH